MIKNDRQYRLTKAQARSFEEALDNLADEVLPAGFDKNFKEVQEKALQSQFDDLTADVLEYEALKNGKIKTFEAQSLAELPTLLVKARIARGMMHKDLAAILQVKEQQIQRWESNDFAGVSIENLKAVAEALEVVLTQRMFVPSPSLTGKAFLSSVKASGVSPDFIFRRLVSPEIAEKFRNNTAKLPQIVTAASTLSKVFGFKMRDLVELRVPQLDLSAVAAARFKVPAKAKKDLVNGYTVYAHYLAVVVASSLEGKLPKRDFPRTSQEFFRAVTQPGSPMTFERVIRFLWDCGVVVLPLREAGGFHGAVWKIAGRFVMALKQTTLLESRWLYDALHETGHIKNGDVSEEVALIETAEISPKNSGDEEEAANEWAEEVLFNGRAEEVEEACTKACGGRLQTLKSVLPKVAQEFNVNLGSLANHMAYRLATQNENWWGAANKLQTTSRDPFDVAREIFFEHVKLSSLPEFDRDLIQRALSEE